MIYQGANDRSSVPWVTKILVFCELEVFIKPLIISNHTLNEIYPNTPDTFQTSRGEKMRPWWGHMGTLVQVALIHVAGSSPG